MAEEGYPQVNGERLREIRMSRGLTLRRLEQASGVPYDLLNELEVGGGAAEEGTIEGLADALEVEPSEFLADH
jgi:transcriptional regulator with XRE-family HTH domain